MSDEKMQWWSGGALKAGKQRLTTLTENSISAVQDATAAIKLLVLAGHSAPIRRGGTQLWHMPGSPEKGRCGYQRAVSKEAYRWSCGGGTVSGTYE